MLIPGWEVSGGFSFSGYHCVDKGQLLHVAYLHGLAHTHESSALDHEKKPGVCTDVMRLYGAD